MTRAASQGSEIILRLPDGIIPAGFGGGYTVDPGSAIPGAKTGLRVAYIETGITRVSGRKVPHGGVLIGYRSTGWLVGDLALQSINPFPLVATAVTKCVIRTMSDVVYRDMPPPQREALSAHILRMYACEMHALAERENGFLTRTPLERIAGCIDAFVTAGGVQLDATHWRAEFPITQIELATYLRLSPEHANRLIHRLRDEKVIAETRWPIITIDQGALADLRKRWREAADLI